MLMFSQTFPTACLHLYDGASLFRCLFTGMNTLCMRVGRTGTSLTKTLAIFPLTFDLWLTSCSVNTACSSCLFLSLHSWELAADVNGESVFESRVAHRGASNGILVWNSDWLPYFSARVHIHIHLLNSRPSGLVWLVLASVHPSSTCFSLLPRTHCALFPLAMVQNQDVWNDWLIETLKEYGKYWYQVKI